MTRFDIQFNYQGDNTRSLSVELVANNEWCAILLNSERFAETWVSFYSEETDEIRIVALALAFIVDEMDLDRTA